MFDTYCSLLEKEQIDFVCRFNVQGQVLQPKRTHNHLSPAILRFGLQESIEVGGVYFQHCDHAIYWFFALEHNHIVQGGVYGGGLDIAMESHVRRSGERAFSLFYAFSDWRSLLLRARRQDRLRRRQMDEADRQRSMGPSDGQDYDKERMLLAFIRAGDRGGARRLLNELLATIYLSAPKAIVLQARVIELVSSLTRAAIEDNPLLESLILQNHQWVERMVHADSFESLSTVLMQALDDFIDAVHLHGSNRTNVHVHKALTYISERYQESISLEDVAWHTGISLYRLAHLFRAHTGKTVVETIRQVRLQRAELLLRQSDMTCAEVGYTVGFSDQSYFISHFKKHAGVTPGKYKRAHSPRRG